MLPVLSAPALAGEVVTTSRQALNADGSTSMNYSTQLEELGAQIGLSMSAPGRSVAPQTIIGTSNVTGTAYAKVSVSSLPEWLMWQKGAVNVVLNPTAEESKLSTSFSRTWTVNDGLKATLADSYEVAHNSSGAGWNTDKSLSVKLEDTGTTFSVGAHASDSTQQFLGRVSARQKVFGNINVTASASETTGDDFSKSVTAGFTHRW
ncbi:hypothetical protein ACT6QH_00970 [Xanthobacter sp. TB0139]|uniref:hypothetical protein n=1 Tax=Xanthobacter sp. TB0139 TaxID=3459178 RepID=UPI0040391705